MKQELRSLELLSPAGNLECGLSALSAGADAIYVGAPKFGARASAGVSVEDIEKLVHQAHFFGAKVYVALNTILYDDELSEAERLIKTLYLIGVDALIIQDMGILGLDIPPIALHASTQCHNNSIQQLKLLQSVGFEQAVLARELSVEETAMLSKEVPKLRLETFVHGALCVSYSGHCYISQALAQRSANRGNCAQYCRLPYTLIDSKGKILARDSHLLSLKDLNRSSILKGLVEAGAVSFKIEGRLKTSSYVRNTTAYYSERLNQIIAENPTQYRRASHGNTTLRFTPDPQKSFSRGSTTYQLGKGASKEELIRTQSPKSEGEPIGYVSAVKGDKIYLKSAYNLSNGDGLAFYTKEGKMGGSRVNTVLSPTSFIIDNPQQIYPGMKLYRNYSIAFEKLLQQSNSSLRLRPVFLLFETLSWGITLHLQDKATPSIYAKVSLPLSLNEAQKPCDDRVKEALSKLGGTGLEASFIEVKCRGKFVPLSSVAELKRAGIEAFSQVLFIRHKAQPLYRPPIEAGKPFAEKETSYLNNIANHQAEKIYQIWGVTKVAPAFELFPVNKAPLMICRHCIRRHIGYCTQTKKKTPFQEPLFLIHGEERIRLSFDCKKCQMLLFATT
ncbi:peptidase U32 family protein [Porphyromonas circumdentaria]|uniref:peptidase U32 family protein n=1 Tax=Porphyromonas circumdentaria TaxID=29524 RepID=UPI0026DCCDB9|nr:U32 family peptidase [Porphyromonas circumdentaria]MDO4721992.1 U32 family peptidase [Porphyromonas circumdentaria]